MPNYGVHASEKATSVSTPVLADVALPFVVGTAPVHMATSESAAKPFVPCLVTSYDEAVSKLGYSPDWKNYTLCEFMYSHFQLYQRQPVIFLNVADPEKNDTGVQVNTYKLDAKKIATLPSATQLKTLKVVRPDTLPTTQTFEIRPKDGKNDYPALYEAAGVTIRDGGIFYAQAEEGVKPDDALKHNVELDYYFVGLTFPKPEGAKKVKITHNSDEPSDDIDLEKDSDNVFGKELVQYFAIADGDGKELSARTHTLKFEWKGDADAAIATTTCTIGVNMTAHAEKDTDYTAWNDESTGEAFVQCSATGALKTAESLTIEADSMDLTGVTEDDIIKGINCIDDAMTVTGKIPDLLLAPGWSHKTAVAAVMAAKCENISSLFTGKCLIDIDTSEDGVRDYSGLTQYKNQNNFVDMNEILCWPMVKLGDDMFHMSTALAGLMAKVDGTNNSVPYESPSNKNLQMDACVLEDGTPVNLTFEQANNVRDAGIFTALNFMSMGWVAWGGYTACYPANTDVKDYFVNISRMFDYVKTTVIKTFWSKIDKPMTRRIIDNIVDTTNIWLNGLVAAEYLYGARVELISDENPLTDLLQGIIKIHIFLAPPPPLQECDFILEYDPAYVEAALMG